MISTQQRLARPLEGIDYAAGRPAPNALKREGKLFVCRYVSTPGNPKNLTRAEAVALRRGGVAIVTVFETSAKRALAGRDAGHRDAVRAIAQAEACGQPPDRPIYFAVDFDATPAEQAAINAYLAGAAAVLGKQQTGVYGGYWVVKRALAAGVVAYAWQTFAWSGGHWHPLAQLQQYRNGVHVAGVSCDLDRAMFRDYGQWPAPATPGRAAPSTSTAKRLPGPVPKPKWFWPAVAEFIRRREHPT